LKNRRFRVNENSLFTHLRRAKNNRRRI
jgi:hypothetical protein